MRPTQSIKQLFQRRDATMLPGTGNALFARIIEDMGFEAVYVSGAAVSNMNLGAPDLGLATMTEIVDATFRIAGACALPLIVDADTGYGNGLNVVRTVRMLERAGAAAIQLEDQIFPKRCGHFADKAVIPTDEMIQKIKAAVDTRLDGDLQIIARTDARAIDGIDSAIERALRFVEAGADVTFVEAPLDTNEMRRIADEIKVPQIANIVFGGKTPDPGNAALKEMGFGGVLFANAALQASIRAAFDVLGSLKRTGSLSAVADRLATFDERQQAVSKDFWDRLDAKYRI